MAIPNYQDFMNSVLQVYATIKGAKLRSEIVEQVANLMHISAKDRDETLKSGESKVASRIHWATYYMYVAGLLSRPYPNHYQITAEGMKVYKSGVKITDAYLLRYQSFVDFKGRSNAGLKRKKKATVSVREERDPEELLEKAIDDINHALEKDILDNLKNVEPVKFEKICVELVKKMGYGDGFVTRYVRDGGVDGIIYEDELGLSKIYLQMKRYKNGRVNETDIRNFSGAMDFGGVKKGVIITTSKFEENAKKAAEKSNYTIILIDGDQLAEKMRKYGFGAKPKKNYDVMEFDASFFDE